MEILGLSETLILQVAAAGLLLAFHLVSARLLPIESYGALNFGLSLGGILALVCTLGYPNLVLRVVVSAVEGRTWGLLKGVVQQSIQSVALLSISCAVLLLMVAAWAPGMDSDQVAGLVIAAVAVTFYPLSFVRSKIARALDSIRCSIVPEEIIRPLSFIALIAMAVIGFGVSPGGGSVAVLLAVSLLLTMASGLWCIGRHMPFAWRGTAPEKEAAEWRRSSRGMMLGGVFQEVITRSDAIALGFLATMPVTAQFSACSKLALLNVFLLKVIDTYYAPRMAIAHRMGDNARLWGLVRKTAALSLVGSIPVTFALFFFPKDLLSVFGAEYSGAALPLQILAIGTLINAATGSVGYALLMANMEVEFARIAALVAAANVAAHAAFTPTFGIIGAAVITAVSVALQNLLMFRVAYLRIAKN